MSADDLARMRESIRLVEAAERLFADRNRYWTAKEGVGYVADQKASTDALRRRSQADAAYYTNRAQMYALAHIAETAGQVPAATWLDPSCAPEGGWPR